MERVDPAAADRFDRFLDGLVDGRPAAADAPYLDPGLAAAARRLHDPDPALDPDPAFLRRLEQQLMPSPVHTIGATVPVPSLPSANGHAAHVLPPSPRAAAEPARSRWPITEAAVAAVVLLALATAWAANRSTPTAAPGDWRGGGFAAIASPTPEGAERGNVGILGEERTRVFNLTVQPGWRIEQIAEEYERLGGDGGVGAFLVAVAAVDRDRDDLVGEKPAGVSLEGYLPPDTYTFRADDPEANVQLMIQNFEASLSLESRRRVDEMGLSLHEVLTFASIVERETQVEAESSVIAAVYLSRYEQGWRLDADPTVQYAIGRRGGEWWPPLAVDDLFVDSPYNTYQHDGLPPGPIANPSLDAIEAVIYPAETDYLFFVAKDDGSGEHAFATTEEAHQANIERYRPGLTASPTAGVEAAGATPTVAPSTQTVGTIPDDPIADLADLFEPDYRLIPNESVNLRAAPSRSSDIIVALPPATPLRFLGGRAPAETPEDRPGWMAFETETGERGWLRETDVEPYGPDPAAPLAVPTEVVPSAPAAILDPSPRNVTFATDLAGVLAGEKAALVAARAEVRRLAAGFDPGCRAGFVLITANAPDISSGVALAETVGDLLREEAPAFFGDAAANPIAQPGAQPVGQVELQIFVNQGCPPAPRPTVSTVPTPTPEVPTPLPPTSVVISTVTPVPTPDRVAFTPTHRLASGNWVNFRAGPSFADDILLALPPVTPLQFLDEQAPTGDRLRDGPLWLKFRTGDGQVGWVREIDTEPYRPDGRPTVPTDPVG